MPDWTLITTTAIGASSGLIGSWFGYRVARSQNQVALRQVELELDKVHLSRAEEARRQRAELYEEVLTGLLSALGTQAWGGEDRSVEAQGFLRSLAQQRARLILIAPLRITEALDLEIIPSVREMFVGNAEERDRHLDQLRRGIGVLGEEMRSDVADVAGGRDIAP